MQIKIKDIKQEETVEFQVKVNEYGITLDEDAFILDFKLEKVENNIQIKHIRINKQAFALPTPYKRHFDDVAHNRFVNLIEEALEELAEDIPNLADYPLEDIETYVRMQLEEERSSLYNLNAIIYRRTNETPEGFTGKIVNHIKETINDIPENIKAYNPWKLVYEGFIHWDEEEYDFVLTDKRPEGIYGTVILPFEIENQLMVIGYNRQYKEKYGNIAE